MSKRANEDQTTILQNKKIRSTKEGHAPDCVDDLCKGCDVGEVEISFIRKDANGNTIDTEPDAQELLSMAIEEAVNHKYNDKDDNENNDMAHRLFDMAIEKYQKEEPDNRVGYATCLVELGKALKVEESLREGLEVLRGEEKKQKGKKDILFKLAGAAITLASLLRKNQDTYFEKREAELKDSDGEMDEVAYEELVQKQQVSREEIKLYKEAICRVKEAFEGIEKEENESIQKEAQTVLHELRAYGQLLTQPFHETHSNAVLDTVILLIQKLPKYEENVDLLILWSSCLLHKEKFVEDKNEKLAIMKKTEEMLNKSNKMHQTQHGKESSWVWEMYAMLRINESNLAEEDDDALDLYDEAIEAFKKAHALNPENQKLAGMVNMLQGLQDEEEE
ncbi:MAG: hypothetical protein EXX96DRAFT_601946 [Benjaminiella poitrasii]|nr:MAG: hypothetical protein EXX96DRAFT_601946 [Benjaminiella poitrasii]